MQNNLSKFHVKYLLYYQQYTNDDSIIITGPCSPFTKIKTEDKIYYFIEQLLEEKIDKANSKIESNFPSNEENIFDLQQATSKLNTYTLNEIVAKFLLEISEYLSPEVYTIVVVILINFRNCYDIVGWEYYINQFLTSEHFKNFNNSDNISLSNLKFAYLQIGEIVNYFISCYLKEEAPFIDYIFVIMVINHFFDWCLIKKYLIIKISLNLLNNNKPNLKELVIKKQ